jgi:GH35 family endo-1,4-beta-xylanase
MKMLRYSFRSVLFFAAGTLAPLCALAQTPVAPATPPSAGADAAVTPYAPKAPASITLKDAFKGRFYVGAAIRPDQVNGQIPKAAELLAREFNSITAENVMKMQPIHPRPGNDDSSYNFAPADQFVEFGLKNNMFIVGHNLCWHSQMPAWMSQPETGQTELTKEVLAQRLKDHIFKVVGRYKGKVKGWDVVNEALADNPGMQGTMPNGLREGSPFNRVFRSPEYILMAFKWAHEADPDAELYYNDYNLDELDFKRANCVELIKYLQANGAKVTAVGMQGHYNFDRPSTAKIDQTIGMFEALGVQVHVTELDVRALPSNAALTAAVGGDQPPAAPAQPPAGGAGAPGGPGARGGRGGRGGLPPIDALKTSLTLTDAQVAAITPLLAADAKAAEAAAAAGDFAKIAESRNATVTEIRKVLNEAQQPQLTALIPAPGGGRGRGPAAPAVPLTPAQQEGLSKRYSEIFEVFLKHKGVTRVTFWGLRDTDSWRRNDKPLLFEDDYSRKPAYDGVIHALSKAAK